MTAIVSALVWPLVALSAAFSAYLGGLATLALLPRRSGAAGVRSAADADSPRLAVVVPAHNEEELLPRLLESLDRQTYAGDRFSVHVIADNCSDATAAVARSFGATAHERVEPQRRGKGQAIAWLLPRLLETDAGAFVFIDADSLVDAAFLETLARHLARGETALQASYRVAEPESAPLVTLRALAFALMHELRGRAKARLGVSCGIWGNGMALQRDLLADMGWESFSSVEDAEQHLKLVLGGTKVRFVPETSVYGFMPASLGAAAGQQTRWEAGRLALLRAYWRPLASRALAARDLSAAVTLAELALPPLSVVVALELAAAAIAAAFGGSAARAIGLAAPLGLAFYVAAGFGLSGLRPRSYLALLHAPGYVLWKLALYGRELLRRRDPAWVRTAR